MLRRLIILCATLASPLYLAAAETDPNSAQGSDRDFVMAAAQSGKQEVYDATVAVSQTRMDGVRKIAQMLQQDHQAANTQLSKIAAAKGLSLPTTEPSRSPTPSFSDQEYVASQVQTHEEAIALFRSEAANGADKDFKAFAAKILPTLERHLAALRALQTP